MIYFLRGFRGITLFPFLVFFFLTTGHINLIHRRTDRQPWHDRVLLIEKVLYCTDLCDIFYVITVNDCTRICYRKKIYIKCFCLFFQCSSSGRFELYSCCALNFDLFHRPKCCWGFTILNSRFELSCKRRTKNSDREMSMGLIICTSQNHPSPYFGGLNHQLQRLLAVNTE